MKYSEKLLDPRWQKKRLEILRRDSYYCVMCGDNKSQLHVHHKKYNGEPWEADDKDLATYCKYCHEIETIASKSGLSLDKSQLVLGLRLYKLSNNIVFIGKVQ